MTEVRSSRKLFVVTLVLAMVMVAGPALAHNWGCWKQPNRTVYVRNTANYWSQANAAINEWHNDTILNMVKVSYHTEVSVFDGNYGATGWGGLASIESYSGCNILHGHARVNYYYGYSSNGIRGVFCQEIGHLFGLDHSNDGGCMGGGYFYSIDSNYNVVSHNINDISSKYSGVPLAPTGIEPEARHGDGHHDGSDRPAVHATWYHNPNSLRELVELAPIVVIAEVTSTYDGTDLVVPVPGLGEAEEDRIPTQRIVFETDRVLRGELGSTFELFQTGNGADYVLAGDPAYVPGQRYVLFLTPREDGTFLVVSPEGRYQVEKGQLTPASSKGFTQAIQRVGLDGLMTDLGEILGKNLNGK